MSRSETLLKNEARHRPAVPAEIVYLLANLILSFAVAMLSACDFGVSMIVAPAYILSQKLGFLTFGQSEYLIQSVLLLVFCLLVRKVKAVYLTSFATCLIYGAMLDLWRAVIPLFNPAVTAPGSMAMGMRVLLFVLGVPMTGFAVALFFRTYLYPQVYDFFVKGISAHFSLTLHRVKTCFDFGCLLVACAMTLLFFRRFVGVGIGTVIITVLNGTLIRWMGELFDHFFIVRPLFPRFAACFEL